MIPFTNFLYFGLLLYPLIPTVILGLLGRLPRWWIFVTTAAMLILQYSGPVHILPKTTWLEIDLVVGYGLAQWLIARVFLFIRARVDHRWIFYVAILLSLLPLLAVKAAPLFNAQSLIGFLGISYVTFRSLDVIIGIQDRLIAALPIFEYGTFLLFFPTISSGPIDRYRRFDKDWRTKPTRSEYLQDLDSGLHHIFTGFLYKFILAALIKQYWLDPAASYQNVLGIGAYMYAYSFYLFFDFAGYSAFAIGVSRFFGIRPPENFNRPFIARNIKDFWNRWHISLSTWFRDHIYMRFVMRSLKGRWFKNKNLGSYWGYLLLFGLMGLWHGFAGHYILYGIYHAVLFIAYDLLAILNKRHPFWGEGRRWQLLGIFITFNLVCFGFLIFSGRLG